MGWAAVLLMGMISGAGVGCRAVPEAAPTPGGLRKISDTAVDRALFLPDGRWGQTLNGRSFQQEGLVSFKGWQYATYYDFDRRLCAARRRIGDQSWEVVRFEDYRFKGNDTHNAAVIGICPGDGTIHLSFDHHGHPLHYRVSRKGVASEPEKARWSAELFGPVTSELEPGKPLNGVTYPRFIVTPEGGLLMTWRIGGSGNGDSWLANYDPAVGRWKQIGVFVSRKGTYEGDANRCAYYNGFTFDHTGRLHVTWCWRETGDPMTNHDLNYAWSNDGGMTWRNNAGADVGVRGTEPMHLESPGITVDKVGMRRGLLNSVTQAADSQGRIHAVTIQLPEETQIEGDWRTVRKQTHYIHYWRDGAGEWRKVDLGFCGCRGQLWFDTADNAYLVFTGDEANPAPDLIIARATAASQWSDWRIAHHEPGRFTGQPLVDRTRESNVLSIYVQEEPADREAKESALRVIDFRVGVGE